MADNVEVKLGADVTPAVTGVEGASNKIRASLADIGARLGLLKSQSADMASGIATATTAAAGHFGTMKTAVVSHVETASTAIESFKGIAIGLGAALAGGLLWSKAVGEMLKFEEEVLRLENVMGMASEEATHMAISLQLAGSNSETYTGIALKLGRQLKLGGDELERLGVKTKDATGNLLPMQEIMQSAFDTMQQYKAGTDQAEFALSVFGRSVGEVYNIMARLPAAQQRAIELQKELGIEMGPKRQKEIEAYRLEMNTFHVILGSIADRIGEAVLPGLKDMASYFNDVGPAVAKFVVNAVKVLITAFEELVAIIKVVAVKAEQGFDIMAADAQMAGAVTRAAFSLNWGQIPGIIQANTDRVTAINRKAAADVLDIWTKTGDRVGKLWQGTTPGSDVGAGPLRSGTKSFTPKPAAGGAAESDVAGFEASLRASESYYNNLKLQQGSFEVWSEAMTRDYWAQVLEFANLSAKDREAITNKFYDAERRVQQKDFAAYIGKLEADKAALGHNIEAKIAIEQKEFDSIAQRYGAESAEAQAAYKKLVDLRQQLANQRQRIADIEAASQEATYKHDIAMNRLAADQQVALRQISAQQRFAIEKDFIDKEFQAEIAGINARIAAMAADPNSDPAALAALKAKLLRVEEDYQTQVTAVANKAEQDRMQYALQASQAVESGFATLFSDLMQHTKSAKDAFKDFANSIVKSIDDIVAKKLAAELFGGGSAGGGILSSIFGALFGGAGAVPSFDVGTPYVPRDTLALVHQGERIVPANQNRGPGGSMQVQNVFHISGPVDSRTQDQIAGSAARGTQRAINRIL